MRIPDTNPTEKQEIHLPETRSPGSDTQSGHSPATRQAPRRSQATQTTLRCLGEFSRASQPWRDAGDCPVLNSDPAKASLRGTHPDALRAPSTP